MSGNLSWLGLTRLGLGTKARGGLGIYGKARVKARAKNLGQGLRLDWVGNNY